MKKVVQCFLASLLVIAFSTVSRAQLEIPAKSPQSTVSQVIGLTDVEVVYSRPGVRDREIFGELVPYNKVWRTGANEPTRITFPDKVTLEGNDLEAGTYALYTIPGKDEWTVILSNNTELWGSYGYQEKDDALRFTVKPVSLPDKVESFTIQFEDLTTNSALISLAWDHTKVAFSIETEVDSKVMAGIDKYVVNMEKNSGGLYFQAASYYYESDKDLNQALAWINKAMDVNKNLFYYGHLKAKILAKQENYKEAIAAARESREMAKAANSEEYVNLNNRLIEEWESK